MANKITTIVDFQVENAKSGLAGLRSSVGDTEGFVGKLKVGFKGLGDTVGAALTGPGGIGVAGGAIAAAGGAALEAVSKFSDLGVQIGAMADATGLSVDQASRWTEIAGDIGIGPDTLESAIGKMNKTAGNSPEKFDAAGISIGRMKDGTIDANATLLNTIDRLNGIKDPAKKAALGAQIFGKGWQGVAELIGEGSDQIIQDLKNVDDAKVFDEDKVGKARDYRKAMDSLHDSFENIVLIIGEQLAPQLSELVTDLSDVTDLATTFKSTWHIPMLDSIRQIRDGWDYFFGDDAPKQAADLTDTVIGSFDDMDRAGKSLADGAMAGLISAEDEAKSKAAEFAQQVDKTNRLVQSDVQAMEDKWDELHGHISQEKAMINYRQQIKDVQTATEEAWKVTKEKGPGSPESVEAIENARLKTLDLQETTADLAQKYTDMPAEKVTNLIAEIDAGAIDALPGQIQAGIDRKQYRIDAHLDSIVIDGETHAAGSTTISGVRVNGSVKRSAGGGHLNAGEPSIVGERGQELFVPDTAGTVVPNGQFGSGPININVSTGPFFSATDMYRTGQMIANALAEYNRRN